MHIRQFSLEPATHSDQDDLFHQSHSKITSEMNGDSMISR